MGFTSLLWHLGLLLCFLAQEDVKEQTYYHHSQGTNLDSVVAVPTKEITTNEQSGSKNYYDGS